LEYIVPICKLISSSEIRFQEVWIIAPVKEAYPIEKGVMIAPPDNLIEHLMAKER